MLAAPAVNRGAASKKHCRALPDYDVGFREFTRELPYVRTGPAQAPPA